MSDVAPDETVKDPDDPPHLWWGETPWDNMPRKELIRETQRLYYAVEEMRGALDQIKLGNEGNWLFGPQSIPTRAMALGVAALAPYRRGDGQASDIYRAFFRVASDLLFPTLARSGWHVCECGSMTSTPLEGNHGKICYDCQAKGKTPAPMRPITWADIVPNGGKKKKRKRA